MITVEEQTELEDLASHMTGEIGLAMLSEEDKRAIEEALRRLPDARNGDPRWSVKPPIITQLAWWN